MIDAMLTLLHSEWPKFNVVSAILSAVGLNYNTHSKSFLYEMSPDKVYCKMME